MTKKESKILNEIFEEVKDDYIRETIEHGTVTVETSIKYRLLDLIQFEFNQARNIDAIEKQEGEEE